MNPQAWVIRLNDAEEVLTLKSLSDFTRNDAIQWNEELKAYELKKALVIESPGTLSLNEEMLVLNGHDLKISVTAIHSKESIIQGLSTIEAPPAPSKQARVGAGKNGLTGKKGNNGMNAPSVFIVAHKMTGILAIDGRGQDGQDGGAGGDAGDGLSGRTGIDFNVTNGPKYWDKTTGIQIGSEDNINKASAGGPGGNAGLPGAAGSGGRGGNGAYIFVDIEHYHQATLLINTTAGRGGKASQENGREGFGGQGGIGGLVSPSKSNKRAPSGRNGFSTSANPNQSFQQKLELIRCGKMTENGSHGEHGFLDLISIDEQYPAGLKVISLSSKKQLNKERPSPKFEEEREETQRPLPPPSKKKSFLPPELLESPTQNNDENEAVGKEDIPFTPIEPSSPEVNSPVEPIEKEKFDPNAKYPYGTRVPNKPGFAIGPYDKREIEVSGMASGTKARCPYTGKIFLVP